MLEQFLLIFTQILKQDGVVADTKILRLHSVISFKVFLICSLVLTIKDIVYGDNVSCLDHGTAKDENLNAYCWTHSTYSVRRYFRMCNVYKDCAYPGVGQLYPGDETVIHKYYQWTSITLFLQAIICYAPRFLWKNFCEEGLQQKLALQGKLRYYPIVSDTIEGARTHLLQLCAYFKTHERQHQRYFFEYCFFEVLGFFSVIANVILIDVLLGYEFLSYGREAISFWLDKKHGQVSPMVKVFPLVAKCDFRIYGPGGNIIKKDPICILPLNSLNSKVYLFLWFYLIFVLIISSLALIYRVLTVSIYYIRYTLLKQKSRDVKIKVVQDLCSRLYIGDWFAIYLMSNNVSPVFFHEFLELLWEEMNERKLSV